MLELLPVGILICQEDNIMFTNALFQSMISDDQSTIEQNFDKFKTLLKAQEFKSDKELNILHNGRHLLILTKEVQKLNVYVVTDITCSRKLHASQMEGALNSKLIKMFTHEFKTPLNWLSGILSSIIPHNSTAELCNMAKHAVDLLNLYIDDIIFFSQKSGTEFKSTRKRYSPLQSVNECILFASSDMKIKGIKYDISSISSIPDEVDGDSVRYKQILNNLLCNSINSCKIKEGAIAITIKVTQESISTLVSDNSPDLSEEEIALLMNSFQEIENPGLQVRFGIGMMLCKEMCKRCNGDLIVSSDKGNKYEFTMPIASTVLNKPESPTCLREVSLIKTTSHYKPLVLLVDDTLFNNEMIKHMLKLLDIDSNACCNGLEAVELCQLSCPANYALILMDINMPIMDGIEATKQIKAKITFKSVPIVMLSAQDDMSLISKAIDAGASDYRIYLNSY